MSDSGGLSPVPVPRRPKKGRGNGRKRRKLVAAIAASESDDWSLRRLQAAAPPPAAPPPPEPALSDPYTAVPKGDELRAALNNVMVGDMGTDPDELATHAEKIIKKKMDELKSESVGKQETLQISRKDDILTVAIENECTFRLRSTS